MSGKRPSNLVTPEFFIQFCPSIQKLFMVFYNTFFYLSQNGVSKQGELTLFCSDKKLEIPYLDEVIIYNYREQ